jgi:hypothetical protein
MAHLPHARYKNFSALNQTAGEWDETNTGDSLQNLQWHCRISLLNQSHLAFHYVHAHTFSPTSVFVNFPVYRAAEEAAEETGSCGKLSGSLRFLSRKARDSPSSEPSDGPERKLSSEYQGGRLKPSLRMKAFKNRQDTFHSLAMCTDQGAGVIHSG